MALKYSILGLLDIYPLSGYDIVKIYDYAVIFYWNATHTQIYRTLKKMDEEGLVISEMQPTDNGPSKKLYRITDEGKTALQLWLQESSELTSFKHSFLLKLSLSHEINNEIIIKHLVDYISQLEKRLEFLKSSEKTSNRSFARTDKEKTLWYLTELNGFMYYENEIKWAKIALAKMKEI